VDSFALKLVVTPVLIGGASLAGRRWGQGVSGWLVGLPLTSGPVAFFLALEQGVGFAAAAAVGSLSGAIAEAAFCVGYARLGARHHYLVATLAGTLAFGAASVVLQHVAIALIWFFLAAVVLLIVSIRLMPQGAPAAAAAPPPRWDIPARIVVATTLVLGLTAAAPVIGPRWSGLLAAFPVYAAILTIFAHQQQGPGPAIAVLRGLLVGLFTFAAFFFVLGATIERFGVTAAFGASIVAALGLHALSFWTVLGGRRMPRAA
jgi:hypothetical protein